MLSKARRVNEERDRIDRSYGFLPPSKCRLHIQLRTVLSAMDCGIDKKDWAIIAEAMCMLQDTESIVRKIEENPV
jgi:hypothetical protein